jgi:hypothetical protein
MLKVSWQHSTIPAVASVTPSASKVIIPNHPWARIQASEDIKGRVGAGKDLALALSVKAGVLLKFFVEIEEGGVFEGYYTSKDGFTSDVDV